MKKVVIVHTSLVSINLLKQLFEKHVPEAELFNIMDDSLLNEVMKHGEITRGITKRLTSYFQMAESIGADAIFSQCSSMGEAADVAAQTIGIPVLKIDKAMMDEAVAIGKTIAVVATVASTIKPSVGLLKNSAEAQGKQIDVVEALVDGALDILLNKGDRERHNEMVLSKIKHLESTCDVIVLAQGSMVVLAPFLSEISVPVLTSPELGVQRMRKVLGLS